MSKSQTWSMDVLIAASVFITGMIVFFYIMGNSGDTTKMDRLAVDSEIIPGAIMAEDKSGSSDVSFVIASKVDKERLAGVLNLSYDELKSKLGISSDFCIHFVDDEGNIVDLDDNPDSTKYSIGNPRLNITIEDENGLKLTLPCGS